MSARSLTRRGPLRRLAAATAFVVAAAPTAAVLLPAAPVHAADSRGVSTLKVDPVLISTGLLLTGNFRATLTGGTPATPIAGETVTFRNNAGDLVCTAKTNTNGVATCSVSLFGLLAPVLTLGVKGEFAGNAEWQPAQGSAFLI